MVTIMRYDIAGTRARSASKGLRVVPCLRCGLRLLLTVLPISNACTQEKQPALVFSVRTWKGDYYSKDIPGGVETTPIVGAIYTVAARGGDVKKIVELGKNTDFPNFSPDGKWIYFQSNASGQSQVYRCRPDGAEVVNLTQ